MPLAAQPAISSGYVAKCQSCHSDLKSGLGTQFSPLFPSQNSSAVYGSSSSIPGRIFSWSALGVIGTPDQIVAAMRDRSRIPTTSEMYGYFSGYIGASPPTGTQDHATNDELLSIYKYLRLVRDAEVAIPAPFFPATAIGLTSNQSISIKVSNYRSVPLNYKISVASQTVTASEFSITAPSALTGICGATLVDAPTECVINTTVTFRPTTPASRTATLDVELTASNGADGNPIDKSDRHVNLSGTGLAPFTVAPESILTFTPTNAPAGTRTVTINDNKGDRIRICRVAAASFSAPTNFSLDAPGSFDANGCFTIATSSVPRQLSLLLHFVPDASGPRFANLNIQRLDDSSNPTGPVTTLQLQGNPGGVATLDASSLFDASGDPGVEVDGDATLTRRVTLSSEGNDPLPFTSSTFTISGPNSSEYAIADTGCKTLAQLPASTTSTPGPACVLTVVFNPLDVGRRGPAKLTIQIAGTTDNVVSLNGLGSRGPRLTIRRGVTPLTSGFTISFGAQTIGGIYPSIPMTLTNAGTQGNLDVILPATGSLPGFSFADLSTCRQLAPAGECEIALQFSPTATQAYASPFLIQTRPTGTNDPVKTFELDLRGQGSVSAVPTLSWTDSSGTPIPQLAFASTTAGTPVTTRVRLYNAGPGGAQLRFANVIGTESANFALDTSSCKSGLDLFEGMSCEVAVTFAPGAAGQKSASMQFVAVAGTPSVTVVAPYLAVTGTSRAAAVPSLLQSSASLVQFATAVVGSSAAPEELRLTNNGTAALNVLNFDVGAPFGVLAKTCAPVPFLLAPGAECAVSLTFQPQAEGRATGKLRITTDTTAAVLEVALDGTGQPKANVSGGGCSIASGDTLTDPTLWALILLAFAALRYRERARSGMRRRQ